MKLWKSMNWNYELDYELMYKMTMKWLWNDYEFIYDVRYEMNYETAYEIMIWIDYELSDLNYSSSMKKYELMYEKVFFNKLIIWKCMNCLNIVSYEVCIYLGLNDTGLARRDS